MKVLKMLFKLTILSLTIIGTGIVGMLVSIFATPAIWLILLAPFIWMIIEFCFGLAGYFLEEGLSAIGISLPLTSFFIYLERIFLIIAYLSFLRMILHFGYQAFKTAWEKNEMKLSNLSQELREESKTLNFLLNFLNNQKLKIVTYRKKIKSEERKRTELKKKLKELKKKRKPMALEKDSED